MIPAKDFYLIRHGETVDNRAHIAAGGDRDSMLTDKGKNQALRIAPAIGKLSPAPQKVFHSPMTRTRETAQNVNSMANLDMIEHPEMYEHKLGDWNGLGWDEVLPNLENKVPAPNGEKEEHFVKRVQGAMEEILEASQDAPPLIVAHGGTFHALGFMYQYSITQIHNCQLHYFEVCDDHSDFPWLVWEFDIVGNQLVKRNAPFCPSIKKMAVNL